MTRVSGNAARWTVAALAAPMVACVFTGTTVWAEGHNPLQQFATKVTTTPAPITKVVAVDDPRVTSLRASVAAQAATVRALTAKVSDARKRAAALAAPVRQSALSHTSSSGSGSSNSTMSASGAATAGGSNGGSSGNGSSQQTTAAGSTQPNTPPPPPPPPAAAPAPAPPTQVTTGASGAPK